LTKLPTRGAAASDSGWTAVLGNPPRKSPSLKAASPRPAAVLASTNELSRVEAASRTGSFTLATPESEEIFIEAFSSPSGAVAGWKESGEFEVGVLGSGELSRWDDFSEYYLSPLGACDEHADRNHLASSFSLEEHAGESSKPEALDGGPCFAPDQLSRFEILNVLGEGRHSTVYRAFDPLLERHVALKLPREDARLSSRALERFLGEARALARLAHPRIVPIYEAGREGDRHYIAMGLVEGRGLDEVIAERLPPFRRSAEIVAELAEALAYAHGLGIIHRDVKPANIRIDHQGAVYLMDFGIAYRPDSGEIAHPPGTILGTPAYLAPEQARERSDVHLPASDQYSLGAVFYELLCGQPPFLGQPSTVLARTVHDEPPSPRVFAPKLPRTLAAICRKAISKRPDQRYPGCQALADDLRLWLRGERPIAGRWGQFLTRSMA
jgi:hypothetical protein